MIFETKTEDRRTEVGRIVVIRTHSAGYVDEVSGSFVGLLNNMIIVGGILKGEVVHSVMTSWGEIPRYLRFRQFRQLGSSWWAGLAGSPPKISRTSLPQDLRT